MVIILLHLCHSTLYIQDTFSDIASCIKTMEITCQSFQFFEALGLTNPFDAETYDYLQ